MEFEVKDDIFYTKEDLWVREDDGLVVIGITDYAQKRLKAVQYVDLPEEDDDLDRGESFGEVESVKSLSQLIAPVLPMSRDGSSRRTARIWKARKRNL